MNSSVPKKSKQPGADRRWTLLFIGDHGNVVTLKRFKAIVLATGFLFVAAIGAVIALFFMHKSVLDENRGFRSRMESFQKKIETLRHEKEILMARLVLSESKMKENTPEQPPGKADLKPDDQKTPESQTESNTELQEVEKKSPPVALSAPPKPELPEARDTEPEFRVAVENFKVSRVPGSANVNAEFRIKNTSPQSEKVSGHAVVVLKGIDIPKHKWLVMPAVSMVGDRPSGKRGKRFSIQRFRTMRFTSRVPDDAGEFQTAAVYIFLENGELALEQDFPVDLPPSRVSLSETPAAPTQSAETSSEVAPSLKMLFSDTPPEDKPAAETPAIEEPLDNF